MKISDSEKHIMDILWQDSPKTANTIVDAIDPTLQWQDKTVKTLINRLLKKDAIGYEKAGREYRYYPILLQDEFIAIETDNFLHKVFDGNVSHLIAAFAQKEKLTEQEISDLKAIVRSMDDD